MTSDRTDTTHTRGSKWQRMPFYLLLLAATLLGAATFVEDARGTDFIHETVYGAAWFKVLWALIVATACWTMYRRRLWRHTAVFMLHMSLILILAGGLTTALTHQTGMLHLRQGATEHAFLDKDRRLQTLPFALRLDTFYIKTYPGTEAPQDYVSQVAVVAAEGVGSGVPEDATATISMNRILRRNGYRFYQSSYDPDGHGTWLTVTYDPFGTPLAYFGFLLFGLSTVFLLVRKQKVTPPTPPSQILSTPSLPTGKAMGASFVGGTLLLLLLLFLPLLRGTDPSTTSDMPCISRAEADSLGRQLVVWNDRVCPFNTLATDVVKKLYGKPSCKGYTPEQVVGSWMRHPETWNRAPIIKIKDDRLRRHLGLTDKYASMNDLFDTDGHYRLQSLYARETDKNSKLGKAIRETDEKAGLVMMLVEGTLVEQPADSADTPSDLRIRAEIYYNRTPFITLLFMMNLTLGFLSLALFIFQSVRPPKRPGKVQAMTATAFQVLLHLSLLTLTIAYILRWYVSGRIPLANGFETMMFVSLVILVLGAWLARRTPAAVPFGFLLSGFTLLVAHLGLMNPQITSLMPVLNSPWLSSHVSIIMISYALLAFTFVLAFLPRTTALSRQLLRAAVLLLGIGIFLGAVWAGVSWGSYWSWDPKEVWALITLIVYALPLHSQSLPLFRQPRAYNIYMSLAFLTVLMTYFGVNFVLGGMHSYAN